MNFPLYIHIPFCRKKCDYCDFFSTPHISPDRTYIQAVIEEVKFYAKKYNVSEWSSVYIGGGTPSILTPSLLKELIQAVINVTGQKSIREFTVEMNPNDVTLNLVQTLCSCGVTRLSLGIQALDDKALNAVGRACSVKKILSALQILKTTWRGHLSVDFIAGLPCQTLASFKNQFSLLREYNIDHVSLYTLTVEEGTPLAKKIDLGQIKWKSDKADRMWICGRNILKKKGFSQYEVSNFSLNEDSQSLHNLAYWNLDDYIGCGAGASGTIYKEGLRWTNTLDIKLYEKFWLTKNDDVLGNVQNIEKLDFNTQVFEYLMMGFRKLKGVSAKDFKNRFALELSKRIGETDGVFAQWKKTGFATFKKKMEMFFTALTRAELCF